MKITLISDTHTKHSSLKLPGGDLLIHAGDISSRGREAEVKNFLDWFSEQQYKYKIFIAGNHDFYFEKEKKEIIKNAIPENVIYLNDSGCELEGIKIWGSPVQPWFYDWAFNRSRGEAIKKHWDLIPFDTSILVTHSPPFGTLDRTVRDNLSVGCEELIKAVQKIKPAIHVFGHIHEGYGHRETDGVNFFNASVLNENYLMVNEAWNFEFDPKSKTILS
jgi:Icc-related predicted phosphoesterase